MRKKVSKVRLYETAGEESGLVGAKELDPSLIIAKYGFAVDSDGKVGGIVTALAETS